MTVLAKIKPIGLSESIYCKYSKNITKFDCLNCKNLLELLNNFLFVKLIILSMILFENIDSLCVF